LIDKRLIAREEFMQKILEERATYQKPLNPTTVPNYFVKVERQSGRSSKKTVLNGAVLKRYLPGINRICRKLDNYGKTKDEASLAAPKVVALSGISQNQLFDLHKYYESVTTVQLDFCFKYLNFYVGLLSALLAATITGLFTFKPRPPLGYILTLGPLLVIFLAIMGYLNVRLFYRRYIEAWMTSLNIQVMLGLRKSVAGIEGTQPPLYKSKQDGSFIMQFQRKTVVAVLDPGKTERFAEDVLEKFFIRGDALRYAILTLICFGVAATMMVLAIVYTMYFDLFTPVP
jgi:hypothetical protein